MKIIFCGGKTGGHIIPLLRIIENIGDKHELYYIGLYNSLEEKIIKKNNIKFYGYDYNKKITSFKRLYKIISNINPDIIISSGGFVSLIPLMIARIKKIKYYLIEENAVMGRCNKLFKRKAKEIYLSFPIENTKKNMILTGNPSQVFKINKNEYPLPNNYKNILILGGSLGSVDLCELAIKLYNQLNDKYNIILLAGRYFPRYYAFNNERFKIYEYIDNVHNLMSNCDCIISRAGSSTIFEGLALNKKMILIPSKKVKDNHQMKNALYLKNNNIAYLYNLDESINKLIGYIINDKKFEFKNEIINSNCVNDILKRIGV